MNDMLERFVEPHKSEHLSYRVKLEQSGFDFYIDVNKWIQKNTKGMWSDGYSNRGYFVEFEFESDAVAFKLRWI